MKKKKKRECKGKLRERERERERETHKRIQIYKDRRAERRDCGPLTETAVSSSHDTSHCAPGGPSGDCIIVFLYLFIRMPGS